MKWGVLATGAIAAKFANTVNVMAAEGETLVAVGSRDIGKRKPLRRRTVSQGRMAAMRSWRRTAG